MNEYFGDVTSLIFDDEYLAFFLKDELDNKSTVAYMNKTGKFNYDRKLSLQGIKFDDFIKNLDDEKYIIKKDFAISRKAITNTICNPTAVCNNLIGINVKNTIKGLKVARKNGKTIGAVIIYFDNNINTIEVDNVEVKYESNMFFDDDLDILMLETQLEELGYMKLSLTNGGDCYKTVGDNEEYDVDVYTLKENIGYICMKNLENNINKISINFKRDVPIVIYELTDLFTANVLFGNIKNEISGRSQI